MPIVHVRVQEGVFDADATRRLGAGATRAAVFDKTVKQAVPEGDARPVPTACEIADVPEGHYGVMGRIFALSDFIAMGGYEHLQTDSGPRLTLPRPRLRMGGPARTDSARR